MTITEDVVRLLRMSVEPQISLPHRKKGAVKDIREA